jgi:N-acetyl-anhydromuramyl-L-alanine amidase AmpD
VSCNRLIAKDGTNYKIVDDEDTAWAQGYGMMGPYVPRGTFTCNDIGLSIELENLNNGSDKWPDAQLNMCAAQIVEWFGRYGFLPVVAHWQIDTRKTDPRDFPWPALYDRIHGLMRLLYKV